MRNKLTIKPLLACLVGSALSLFLSTGYATLITFNINNYHQCHSQLRQCPKNGPYYSANCVAKAAQNIPACQPLANIAKTLNTSINTLTASVNHGFYIITQYFFADGQQQYFLLTPQGKLVNTLVDPRKLNPVLNKKYQKANWIITNTRSPHYQSLSRQQKAFTVDLKINENCLACTVFGYATVLFLFNEDNQLTKQELIILKRK